jgi:hypothetical protein
MLRRSVWAGADVNAQRRIQTRGRLASVDHELELAYDEVLGAQFSRWRARRILSGPRYLIRSRITDRIWASEPVPSP